MLENQKNTPEVQPQQEIKVVGKIDLTQFEKPKKEEVFVKKTYEKPQSKPQQPVKKEIIDIFKSNELRVDMVGIFKEDFTSLFEVLKISTNYKSLSLFDEGGVFYNENKDLCESKDPNSNTIFLLIVPIKPQNQEEIEEAIPAEQEDLPTKIVIYGDFNCPLRLNHKNLPEVYFFKKQKGGVMGRYDDGRIVFIEDAHHKIKEGESWLIYPIKKEKKFVVAKPIKLISNKEENAEKYKSKLANLIKVYQK